MTLTGYVEVLVIPAGARRIKVVEEKPAHSYLGNLTQSRSKYEPHSLPWQFCNDEDINLFLVTCLNFPGSTSCHIEWEFLSFSPRDLSEQKQSGCLCFWESINCFHMLRCVIKKKISLEDLGMFYFTHVQTYFINMFISYMHIHIHIYCMYKCIYVCVCAYDSFRNRKSCGILKKILTYWKDLMFWWEMMLFPFLTLRIFTYEESVLNV